MAKETIGISMVAGLGNIGREYEGTRHNAGFLFADLLARRLGASFLEERKFSAQVARAAVAGRTLWILKPTTYMNLSGTAVQAAARYYHIEPAGILVAHDELDLPPGCMKMKIGGGNAGHNGLRDISQKLATNDFWRLRLGTGHPRTLGLDRQVVDFVLHKPSDEHRKAIEECAAAAAALAEDLVLGNFQAVQRALAPYGKVKKETPPPAPDGR